MTCQICEKPNHMILKIGRHEWCQDCLQRAMILGEDAMRQRYAPGGPTGKTHGERELEKRLAARQNALKDFNADKW